MNHIDVMKQALADMELIAERMGNWGAYASEYFQKKHRFAEDIVEADAAIERLSKSIEEAEKVEPVAIVNEGMGGIEWLDKPLSDDTPLYTAPPKRKWVGLTDEEITDIGMIRQSSYQYARAIEAKLKEKNT